MHASYKELYNLSKNSYHTSKRLSMIGGNKMTEQLNDLKKTSENNKKKLSSFTTAFNKYLDDEVDNMNNTKLLLIDMKRFQIELDLLEMKMDNSLSIDKTMLENISGYLNSAVNYFWDLSYDSNFLKSLITDSSTRKTMKLESLTANAEILKKYSEYYFAFATEEKVLILKQKVTDLKEFVTSRVEKYEKVNGIFDKNKVYANTKDIEDEFTRATKKIEESKKTD